MSQLLDDQYTALPEESIGKTTKNIRLKSGLYFLIMLAGGMIYHRFYNVEAIVSNLIYFAVVIISFCIFISLILEVFRLYFRSRKSEKKGKKAKIDPLWFLILEGGFSIWLLIFFLILLVQFIS